MQSKPESVNCPIGQPSRIVCGYTTHAGKRIRIQCTGPGDLRRRLTTLSLAGVIQMKRGAA